MKSNSPAAERPSAGAGMSTQAPPQPPERIRKNKSKRVLPKTLSFLVFIKLPKGLWSGDVFSL